MTNTLTKTAIAIALVSSTALPAYAGTTTADFLKWERKAQEFYLQVSISMAATVATQVRPETATCINEWYFQTEALQAQRNAEIIELMPQYQTFHPTSLLLAYIEDACGKFIDN